MPWRWVTEPNKPTTGAQETAMERSLRVTARVAELAQAVETGDGPLVCSFLGTDDIWGLNPAAFASAPIDLRLTVLVGALTPLVHGRDLARGAVMAEALLLAARRTWTSTATEISAENYGSAADLAATAWQRLGRQEEVVALARDQAPAILPLTNGYRAASLTYRDPAALIQHGRSEHD